MTIDKYTKFILTLIAVGVIGINFHLFNESFVKEALANTSIQKVQICDGVWENDCVSVYQGKLNIFNLELFSK